MQLAAIAKFDVLTLLTKTFFNVTQIMSDTNKNMYSNT